ncbi:hypothetical protein PALB_14400 [Pseudoalteromonas luteoviolacea B = ATCC 29581]|nr:hypothetical protein PALB_14400 [Pseudoalteromonas luteoviolacea B = ATCC 29581]
MFALLCFSMVNIKAKHYLKRVQKAFKQTCVKIDLWLSK